MKNKRTVEETLGDLTILINTFKKLEGLWGEIEDWCHQNLEPTANITLPQNVQSPLIDRPPIGKTLTHFLTGMSTVPVPDTTYETVTPKSGNLPLPSEYVVPPSSQTVYISPTTNTAWAINPTLLEEQGQLFYLMINPTLNLSLFMNEAEKSEMASLIQEAEDLLIKSLLDDYVESLKKPL